MEEFKNYKEKQNYYKNKYKNRDKLFFGQNETAQLFVDDKVGNIKNKKGRTYIKFEKKDKE